MSFENLWNQVDSLALADIRRAGYSLELEAAEAGTRIRYRAGGMTYAPWGSFPLHVEARTVRELVRQLELALQDPYFGPPPKPRPSAPTQVSPRGKQ